MSEDIFDMFPDGIPTIYSEMCENGRLQARVKELEKALREIRRRFKLVALNTPDDQDYDLTYLSGAIQDSREVLGDD